jgi:hypothetical protein
MRNAYRILVGEAQGNRSLEDQGISEWTIIKSILES